MKFSREFPNRGNGLLCSADTVVVIDVLRSFTTAAVSLARGATAIYPFAEPSAALAFRQQLTRPLSVGAVAGGAPIPGFDFGNSPSALLPLDLGDMPVVMSSAAGVRDLHAYRQAPRLYAASLVCARATVQAIRTSGAQEVCFVITGEFANRDGDEDIACADYMEALLRGESPAPDTFVQRVRQSDFGKHFIAGTAPHLPLDDLDIATRIDWLDFAMPVHREGDTLVIRRSPPG